MFRATPAHRILAFRAFPAQPAAASLDARCSLAVESAPAVASCLTPTFAPAFVHFSDPIPHPLSALSSTRVNIKTVADISHGTHRRTSKPNDERPTPALKRQHGTPKLATTGSVSDQGSSTPAGEDPDFRALLRLSSRSLPGIVRHPEKPMLSWPSPLRGQPARLLGSRPPLSRFPTRPASPLPKEQARNRTAAPQGLSSRTWELLRRVAPTSMRSPTSSACPSIPSCPHTRQRPGECAVEPTR